MSIFSKILRGVWHLLYPPMCPVCGSRMHEGERFVCTACRYRIPLTGYCTQADNPVARMFWGLLPVEQASAFIFFVEGSDWRRLIHGFKYHGAWLTARRMGEWYGAALRASDLYGQVDAVVPVPLNWRKRLLRGYNQSEYLADGIAAALGVPCITRAVRRTVNNRSQALRAREERWENVQGIFRVVRPDLLQGCHVLLVDDVLTTGATVSACAEALLAAAPDLRLSIATLAVSRHSVGEF